MFKKVLNVLTSVVLVILIVIVIIVFVTRINNGVPSVFGFQVYRVSSDSMTPVLEVGDIILDKKVDPSEIHEGDIVTYQGQSGDFRDKIVTHKVVKEPVLNDDGSYSIQTCGIREGAILDPEINSNQVYGKYLFKMAFLNGIYTFFLSPYGLVVFIGIIVILFAYEIISMILSYKSVDDLDESDFDDDEK